MFEFVRTHRRLMQFVLLLFIFPSFAFVGVEGLSRLGDDANVIAKVAGQPVTRQEFDAEFRSQMDRMREMFGDQFDPAMFDTPEVRQNILDNLIARRALAAEASSNNIVVPDQVLQQTVLSIPDVIVDGKFDNERYKTLLAMQGMTPAMYEARLRQDLAVQNVNSAVQTSGFVSDTVATRLSELSEQERVVQELSFKPADFVAQVNVTDDMLKAYYDKHGAEFVVPEKAKAEYVVLSQDALAAQTEVSDAEIKSYYEQNAKRYTAEEQRRASHILIAAGQDASDSEKAAAKAKAEKLLEQVRKNPAEFAKVAKENSDDPGSAERGGDLDYFGKGMMVKPFEDAAYQLKQGEISDAVETDFGYHIIQVTGIKPAEVKDLDEVRDEIAAEIKKQKVAKKFAAAAEQFSDMVYEQSDSLKPVAEKLGLKIETVPDLSRVPNPAIAPTAPYNSPKFLQALFADDSLKNKRNTEAIEVAPNTLVAGRIIEYKPSSKKPLEEVKDVVHARVLQTEAAALAEKAGKEKLAQLKSANDVTGFSEPKTVSRTNPQNMDAAALRAVMRADQSQLPAYVGVDRGQGGYSIFRVNEVKLPENIDKARRDAERQQIANAQTQQEMFAYLEFLKKKAETEILKPVTQVKLDADGEVDPGRAE